jgi:heavy metal translocating P-type ATPase
MQVSIAHSVRGRLRVRVPSGWLGPRRAAVEAQLRGIAGVRSVEGRPLTGSVCVDYDPFVLAERGIVDALDRITKALDASPAGPRRTARPADRQPPSRGSLFRAIGATSVLAATCCLPTPPALAAGLVLAASVPTLFRAGVTLATRPRLNGDVLDASTLALLTLRGHVAAAALLTCLRSVGEYIVARSVVTTRRSLWELVSPEDQTVTCVTERGREIVRVASLRPGDLIVVSAGHTLPVDGTVVGGEALVNQQTMTGEALPVERRTTDVVFAATSVEDGEIEVRVDGVGPETAVGRIVAVIEAAADEKPDVQVFAERLADREVGRTLALATAGTVFTRSLDAGTAILVADYGMAARVGIPTAVVASMRRAATLGILIKGPRPLERLARVDTVVFDKTGTLTSGTPHLGRIVTYADRTEDAVLRLAAAAESGFRHPVARAIARYASERRLEIPKPTSTSSHVGLGVDVHVGASRVVVGNRRFLEARGVDLRATSAEEAAAHAMGASSTFVAIDGILAAALVLQDALRADAQDAVQALRRRRMRNVIMLSGDHPEPTRVIAESLGLRHHYAELLPGDKARLIRELKAEGRVVAMVGDGVNDALALSEADVGLAVPGGAEVATEAADVVLLRGGLDQVVRALDLARDSIASVRRTLGTAARANLGVVGLASLGLARPIVSILLSHGAAVGAALLASAGSSTPAPARPES